MSSPMTDGDLFAEDYYSLLNLAKDASPEEVNAAFRRLSRIYHPDKHAEPAKKKQAETLFNKIKSAHEVLSDKHRRTVYDIYGEKGLQTDGLEIISRIKTPAEIIAEYERLQREREERLLQQRTNPRGTINIGIDATDFFDQYEGEDYRPSIPSTEIRSMSVFQSVEAPLTLKDTIILSGNLGTQNGTGSGTFMATWRRLTSVKGWAELEASAGNGFGVSLKGFRQISKRCFGTATGSLHSVHGGVRPGVSTMLAYQLDRSLQGRILWNIFRPSSMSTVLVYDTEKHHAMFSLQIGIPNSFVTLSYARKFPEQESKVRGAIKFGTFGAMVEYGFEKKVSQFSILGATISVGIPLGVNLRIKVSRGQQTFIFPIHLSELILPSAIFYGTAIPFTAYHALRVLIIQPFLKQQKEMELEKQKEENAEKLLQRRREAEAAIVLMQESVDRIREQEERKSGLLILKASYGRLMRDDHGDFLDLECIDVTIPLQALVKESKLVLPDSMSKSGLPGFYDPCLGEEKSLYIRYRFRNKLHQITLSDKEHIRLPQQKHIVKDETERGSGSRIS